MTGHNKKQVRKDVKYFYSVFIVMGEWRKPSEETVNAESVNMYLKLCNTKERLEIRPYRFRAPPWNAGLGRPTHK